MSMESICLWDNRWWLQIKEQSGFTHRIPTDYTHRREEKKAALLLLEVKARIESANRLAPERPSAVTLGAYAPWWVGARRSRGVPTWRREETALGFYILPVLGHIEMRRVGPLEVARLEGSQRWELVSPSTRRRNVRVLRTLFMEAMIHGVVDVSPFGVSIGSHR